MAIKSVATRVADAIIVAAKAMLGIQSPSKIHAKMPALWVYLWEDAVRCEKKMVVLNTSVPRGKERRTYSVSIRRSCDTVEHYDGIGLHDAVELAKANSDIEYIYDDLAGEFVELGVLERRLKIKRFTSKRRISV